MSSTSVLTCSVVVRITACCEKPAQVCATWIEAFALPHVRLDDGGAPPGSTESAGCALVRWRMVDARKRKVDVENIVAGKG